MQTANDLIRVLDPQIDADEISTLKNGGVHIVDTFSDQTSEMSEIPELRDITPTDRYVFYPWKNTMVRIPDQDAFIALRTNRNKNLILDSEQHAFQNKRAAFAGLNVGNPGAVCVALEGGARRMIFADPDHLSLTNLNRFRAGLPDLGLNKALLTARQVLEIDPYYQIDIWDTGVSATSLGTFLTDVDILVEEMDILPLKLAIREEARSRGIPVVMVTGNGAGVILDVERFDSDPSLPLLNGYIPAHVASAIQSEAYATMAPADKVALARDFMGVNTLDTRLVESFAAFGKTLAGIPQIAESSFLRGAAICYAVRTITTGGTLHSGRYALSLNSIFGTV